MVQIFLLASTRTPVASKTTRCRFVVLARNPRPNPNDLHTLLNIRSWMRALPQTTTQTLLLTLRSAPRPKKHSDKSKHKSRARFLPSSSEEDQSPERRHRSPKPSGKSYTDQDHPQHDPDPPYYREVALSDIPSQYAEEVDTF